MKIFVDGMGIAEDKKNLDIPQWIELKPILKIKSNGCSRFVNLMLSGAQLVVNYPN